METLRRARETGRRGRAGGGVRGRCFWVLTRPVRGRLQVMSARLPRGGSAVAVFSFEEEARMFLALSPGGDGGGWAVRPTYPGEMASFLLDPCRQTGRVSLDPLPGADAAPVNALASMACRDFLGFLL